MPKFIHAPQIEVHDDGVHCGDKCPHKRVKLVMKIPVEFCPKVCLLFDNQLDGNKRLQNCLDHEKSEARKTEFCPSCKTMRLPEHIVQHRLGMVCIDCASADDEADRHAMSARLTRKERR